MRGCSTGPEERRFPVVAGRGAALARHAARFPSPALPRAICRTLPAAWLPELEEELLQFCLAVSGLLGDLLIAQTVAHAAGEDFEAGLVERARGRRDLPDDLAAFPAGLEHADDPTDLALDTAE